MLKAFRKFQKAHIQTKLFIMMSAIYLIALIWTTAQAYARLSYSRSDLAPPIVIHIPSHDSKS